MDVIDGDGNKPEYKINNIRALAATTTMTAEQALHSALGMSMTDVLIIGYVDNKLVIRSSRMSRSEALFMAEQGKRWALKD